MFTQERELVESIEPLTRFFKIFRLTETFKSASMINVL